MSGKTEMEQLLALEKVHERMSEAGLRLRQDKCVFCIVANRPGFRRIVPKIILVSRSPGCSP